MFFSCSWDESEAKPCERELWLIWILRGYWRCDEVEEFGDYCDSDPRQQKLSIAKRRITDSRERGRVSTRRRETPTSLARPLG